MEVEALRHAVKEDKENGALPFAVVATVGTTSTASIDPVEAIADVCEKEKLWLHVDAAYAGSAAIVPELQDILRGCARADSIVSNPHKWLFTPFDLSVLYTRHLDVLKQAFSLVPEYLKTSEPETVRNQMDYGVQLGRRFRSLKLWMVLRYFGQNGIAARIREHCRLAKLFASWVEESADWELMAPVHLSLVCFRFRPRASEEMTEIELNALNEKIMNDINATGSAYLSHTKLGDQFTLRLAIGNIRTSERHIRKVWELIMQTAESCV